MNAHHTALDQAIASLAAQVHAATHALHTNIREFDECEAWREQGYKSCAHYLSFRIGLSKGAAREHVRVAHALKTLPLIDAAFASGALSYSKARALIRVATPQTEESLLDAANDISAESLETLVRAMRRVETADDAMKREEQRSVFVPNTSSLRAGAGIQRG